MKSLPPPRLRWGISNLQHDNSTQGIAITRTAMWPTLSTCLQATTLSPTPGDHAFVPVMPAFSDSDLISLQALDPAIHTMVPFLYDTLMHDIPQTNLDTAPNLKHLIKMHSNLRLKQGLLVYVSDSLSCPTFMVPRNHRGLMLVHAHD